MTNQFYLITGKVPDGDLVFLLKSAEKKHLTFKRIFVYYICKIYALKLLKLADI